LNFTVSVSLAVLFTWFKSIVSLATVTAVVIVQAPVTPLLPGMDVDSPCSAFRIFVV
jgi:hypothetical protein